MRGSRERRTTTGWLGRLFLFPTAGTPPADRSGRILFGQKRAARICAGHLHDWNDNRGCAGNRVPRLSHKAVLGEVADRAARERIVGLFGSKTQIIGAQ
jgi:hypothetical protein